MLLGERVYAFKFSVVPQTLWALLTMETQSCILSKQVTETEIATAVRINAG